MRSALLSRAALAGAATGGRTFTGLAALALATPPDAVDQPDLTLTAGLAKAVIGVVALGELVADKLAAAPSRLAAPGIGGRIAVAAAAGVIVARRTVPRPARHEMVEPVSTDTDRAAAIPAPDTATTVACATIAVGTAVAAAWLGVQWRGLAGPQGAARLITALVEDAAVVGLAAAGART